VSEQNNGGVPAPIPFTASAQTKRERPQRDSDAPEPTPIPGEPWWSRRIAWASRNTAGLYKLLGLALVGFLAYGMVTFYRDWRADAEKTADARSAADKATLERLAGIEAEQRAMRVESREEGRETRRVLEAIRDSLQRRR
jgi:hypothetical protein